LPIQILSDKIWFPPVENAMADGLLAIGGDLNTERLILAYKSGIFPWYDADLPLWWYPNPRFVLLPNELKISKSMLQIIKQNKFEFTINKAFNEVIVNCKNVVRKDQFGTWINNDVLNAYIKLHEIGYAHSAEAWHNNKLVGGLYGIRMGKVFFGESMFSSVTNASKFAFVKYVNYLVDEGVELIDCQVYTQHLESLGAKMIMKEQFAQLLQHLID
jgi:leucyl/phenylalanyl-tRNA--protein transferase